MTIQKKDSLLISGKKYDVLVGVVDGRFKNIFNVMDLDLKLNEVFNSACFNGYEGDFIVYDGRFKLKDLQVDLENTDTLINGVRAIKQKTIVEYFTNEYAQRVDTNKKEPVIHDLTGFSFFNSRFESINIDINFTGDVIIGYGVGENKKFYTGDCLDGWIDSYEKLKKLTLKEGEVISLNDITEEDIYIIQKEEERIEEESMRRLREDV